MGLSKKSMKNISSWVKLEGTGQAFSTPLIYRFLEKYVPAILRSMTNVHIRGAHKVPLEGPAIFCGNHLGCLLYTSPSPRDKRQSRMPSSA